MGTVGTQRVIVRRRFISIDTFGSTWKFFICKGGSKYIFYFILFDAGLCSISLTMSINTSRIKRQII